MISTQAIPTRHTPTSIAGAARRLIEGTTPDVWPTPADLDHSLLGSASVVLMQLRILNQRCRSTDHHAAIVSGIFGLATSYGVCPPSALGVSGMLVDRLRSADEAQLGHVLASAHHLFTAEELTAGAAALLAATTSFLADAVGEDPTAVHDEVHRPSPASLQRPKRHFCTRSN